MLKNLLPIIIIISIIAVSCSKGDVSAPLIKLPFTDSSETKTDLDSTNFGVYKAVLADKSGHVKMYFYNGDTILKAYLTLDSLKDTLTCSQTFSAGNAITAALFTGRISSFIFNADDSGHVATINSISVIGISNVIGQIAHESSKKVVYCYACKYTGNEQGNFNFIHYGNKVGAVAKSTAGDSFKGTGSISGDIFLVDMPGINTGSSVTFQGGIESGNKDYYAGTWIKTATLSGSFSGVRIQ